MADARPWSSVPGGITLIFPSLEDGVLIWPRRSRPWRSGPAGGHRRSVMTASVAVGHGLLAEQHLAGHLGAGEHGHYLNMMSSDTQRLPKRARRTSSVRYIPTV